MNRPYAGGYITEHYGRPARDVHAVQIEINRGLYLDELTLQADGGLRQAAAGSARASPGRCFNELPALFERRAAAE